MEFALWWCFCLWRCCGHITDISPLCFAYSVPKLNVSYKPQKISPKFPGTVRELMHKKIREAYTHPQFISDVMKPLSMEAIIDNTGELLPCM